MDRFFGHQRALGAGIQDEGRGDAVDLQGEGNCSAGDVQRNGGFAVDHATRSGRQGHREAGEQ
jgi:hypothetical protein